MAVPSQAPVARLLLAGTAGGTAIGGSILRAARAMGIAAELADTALAFEGPRLLRIASWHLLGKRPPRIGGYGRTVLAHAEQLQPHVLLATGLAPLCGDVLRRLGDAGVRRINYLTDDPWNPAHRTRWFHEALPHYDVVYTPRRANMPDLLRAGCRSVRFLPFAYDPDVFYPPPAAEVSAWDPAPADVVFAGGADGDRIAYLQALADSGLRLALYGGYWERVRALRAVHRGTLGPAALRRALAAAKVGLCLVRRANRDGNCMRTFEVPAVGTCMLAEETAEHQEIFGRDGEQVLYFRTAAEMVARCRQLCEDDALRARLAAAANRAITGGGHTWAARLASMLADQEWHGGRG